MDDALAAPTDKFIPSFVVKYGNGTGALGTEQTANFDLLVTNVNFDDVWQTAGYANSWESLKSYNPDMVIVGYQLGPGGYDVRNFPIGQGWEWIKSNHGLGTADRWTSPGYGDSSAYLQGSLYTNQRAMNLGNPNWRAFWREQIYADWWGGAKSYDANGLDGIFSDVTSFEVTDAGKWLREGTSTTDHPQDYYTGSYRHDLWKPDMIQFFNETVTYLGDRQEDLKLIPNFGYMDRNPEYWAELDQIASPPFAAMQEAGFVQKYGAYTYNSFEWERKVSTINQMDNTAVLMMEHGDHGDLSASGLSRMSETGTGGRTGWEALWYSITSFLMALNEDKSNGYLGFTIWNYTHYEWFDEFDPEYLHLGPPRGAYFQQDGVYFREYEDGWVVSNPTSTDAINVSVPNGQQARVVTHDNFKDPTSSSLVSTFNIESHHGLILLKSGRDIGNSDNDSATVAAAPPARPSNLQVE